MTRSLCILSVMLFGTIRVSRGLTFSTASSSSLSAIASSNVVVVGGGPVGLAAALTLARPPHCCNVTVLEAQKGIGQATYDPARSYLYGINGRGVLWFDRMEAVESAAKSTSSSQSNTTTTASVLQKLKQRALAPASGAFGKFVAIPADPAIPINDTQVQMSSGFRSAAASNTTVFQTTYLIPRHQIVGLLQEKIREMMTTARTPTAASVASGTTTMTTTRTTTAASVASGTTGCIQLLHGKCVKSIVPSDSSTTVCCTDGTNYTAQLVVAADGINSTVRACLANCKLNAPWIQHNPRKFVLRRSKSPATGLKLKAMQFPPNVTLVNTDGSLVKLDAETMYAIRGKLDGFRTRLSLGMLPVKDPNLVRPANAITRPNHHLWSLRTGPAVKSWFQTTFPRIQWQTLISDTEWERFAAANGTTYPYCQYSPGSAVWTEETDTAPATTAAGIVMVGDACHAFPPDIGQGINAGLQDVVALDQALQGKPIQTALPKGSAATAAISQSSSTAPPITTITLAQALKRYQEDRQAEHKALVRLARIGAPYIYRQPLLQDRIGNLVWASNFALRFLLHKLLKITPPPALMLAQQHHLTYRQVMQRADTMTLILKSIFAAILIRLFLPYVH